MQALARPAFSGVLHRSFLGLVLISVAGLAVRLVEIDRWPLWGDEGQTLLIAQWPVRMLYLAPVDPTPGLYYTLHKLLLGPAVGVMEARSISLICGTLLIPAAYWLARELRVPALLTAALVALSFPLIDYSQEARAYALLVLLVTCSAASFVRWSRSREPKHLLAAILFAALSFYTHVVSIFWIGPMLLAVLWIGRRPAMQYVLLFVLLGVPEFSRLLTYNPGNFSWLAQASPVEAGDTLSRAVLPFRPAGLWAAGLALVIGWRIWTQRENMLAWGRERPGAAFALAVLVGIPVAIWLFGLVAKPLFMTRTILIAVPGFMAAFALILKFEHRSVRFGVVALYAASLLITGTTRVKDDWREIAGRAADDAVLMCRPWQAAAFRHAGQGRNRIFLRYPNALAEVAGTPWPVAYHHTLTTKKLMPAAQLRAARASQELSPVWPIRTGRIGRMVQAPMTLRQAIAYCDRVTAQDARAGYIPD